MDKLTNDNWHIMNITLVNTHTFNVSIGFCCTNSYMRSYILIIYLAGCSLGGLYQGFKLLEVITYGFSPYLNMLVPEIGSCWKSSITATYITCNKPKENCGELQLPMYGRHSRHNRSWKVYIARAGCFYFYFTELHMHTYAIHFHHDFPDVSGWFSIFIVTYLYIPSGYLT